MHQRGRQGGCGGRVGCCVHRLGGKAFVVDVYAVVFIRVVGRAVAVDVYAVVLIGWVGKAVAEDV